MGESLDWIYKLNELKQEEYIDEVLYFKRQHQGNCLNKLSEKQIQQLDDFYLINALARRGVSDYFYLESNKAFLKDQIAE